LIKAPVFSVLSSIENLTCENDPVVRAPLLPSDDQGRKGGFAPLPKQHPILRGIASEIQAGIRFFSDNFGLKTRREFGHSHKLGAWMDTAKPTILAKYPYSVAQLILKFSLPCLVRGTALA
jgi:hypothetical protein